MFRRREGNQQANKLNIFCGLDVLAKNIPEMFSPICCAHRGETIPDDISPDFFSERYLIKLHFCAGQIRLDYPFHLAFDVSHLFTPHVIILSEDLYKMSQ